MSDRNNYKSLRFENETTWKPFITQRELAEKLKIGFSTVCKIEKEGCNTASVSTVKAYREYFLKEKKEDICYEYWMEETNTKEQKYCELGKLFPFDDNFYKNLTKLLELDENNHFIELMLSALLQNPQELFNALCTIFNALYKINTLQKNTELSAREKNESIKMQEYIFNQSTIDYLENTIMPLLQRAFVWKEEELALESNTTQQELNELSANEDISSVNVKITSITPIENDEI